MLRQIVAVGVRFNVPPSEVLKWPVSDLELVLGHFLIEQQEAARAAARSKAKANLSRMRR